MNYLEQLISRINHVARAFGDALQLRGFKSGGSEGQVPIKNSGTDFDWSWGDVAGGGVSHAAVTIGSTAGALNDVLTLSAQELRAVDAGADKVVLWDNTNNKLVYASLPNGVSLSAGALSLGAIVPTTVNGLTLAAAATGFTITGGTTSKTLTVPETMTLGSMASETATNYIAKTLAGANTILYAVSDNTPAALALSANTFPARSSSGNISAKVVTDAALSLLDDSTIADMRTTLGLTDFTNEALVSGTGNNRGIATEAQLKLVAQTWGGSGMLIRSLASDTAARTSTTTYADETGITLPTLAANKPYRVEWSIPVSAGAGGVKMQMTFASLKNANLSVGRYFTASSGTDIALSGTSPRILPMGNRSSGALVMTGSAIIHTDASSVTPSLQWAQNSSSAEETKLLATTTIVFTPLFAA